MINEEIRGKAYKEEKLGKQALTKAYIKEAGDNASRAGQAVLKITGFSNSRQLLKAHSNYLSRNGKVVKGASASPLSKGALDTKLSMWELEDRSKSDNRRIAVKMILSAPKGSDPRSVERAATEFARNTFADNHDYFSVLHTNTEHPHVHLVVQMQGFNGKRLNPRKADLRVWRESFAKALNKQGIRVISTSRASRGVSNKGDRMAVRKLRDRGEVPYHEAEDAGVEAGEKPWIAKQQRTNDTYRRRYRLMGQVLSGSKDPETALIGKEIADYAEDFPAPITRREELPKNRQNAKERDVER